LGLLLSCSRYTAMSKPNALNSKTKKNENKLLSFEKNSRTKRVRTMHE